MIRSPLLIHWKSWWNLRIPRFDGILLGLCAVWVFLFRLPAGTPLESMYYKAELLYFAVMILFFLVYKGYRMVFKGEGLRRFEIVLLALLLVPFAAAVITKLRFGQPVPFGLATQREFLNLLTVLLLFNLLHRGTLTLPMVRTSLLWVVWGTVLFFLFIYFFVDYQSYAALGGQVSFNPLRGERLRWERFLTAFGGIYYGILFLRMPNWKTAFPLGLMAGYIILVTLSRGYTICYLATMGAFMLEQSARVRGRGIKLLMIGLFVSVFVIFAPLFLSEDLRQYIAVGFGSIIKVLLTGDYTAENSINARIHEYELIVPYIANHPWLGYGEISNRWVYSIHDLVGRIWVNDLGIIGGIFTYGVLGVGFLLLPYWLYGRVFLMVGAHRHDTFMLACKYYLFYYLLNTLIGNSGVHNPAPGMLMLALLLFYCQLLRQQRPVSAGGDG